MTAAKEVPLTKGMLVDYVGSRTVLDLECDGEGGLRQRFMPATPAIFVEASALASGVAHMDS